MVRPPTVLSRLVRLLAATCMAMSWSVLAALPAAAEVTGWGVQTPGAGAVLDRPTDLVVYVDRTASPEEETVAVQTRILDGAGQPISEKVLSLKLKRQVATDTGDQLTFGGTIDPYLLEWMNEPGVVANGSYTLQYQIHVATGEVERTYDWTDHPIVFDAPPPPPGQPKVKVADAAAKRMKISWAPSDAPDLLHYSVERRVDGGPWEMAQELVAPDTTKLTDTVAVFGSYRYRVTAVRPDGNGTEEYRAAVGDASSTTELEAPREPARRGTNPDANEDVTSGPGQARVQAPARPQAPQFRAPVDANLTYEGPLDYGVEPTEVTERVPIEVARGGSSQAAPEDRTALRVLRSVDQERVLPAVAGGLIFLLSAAHVVRYLNE